MFKTIQGSSVIALFPDAHDLSEKAAAAQALISKHRNIGYYILHLEKLWFI